MAASPTPRGRRLCPCFPPLTVACVSTHAPSPASLLSLPLPLKYRPAPKPRLEAILAWIKSEMSYPRWMPSACLSHAESSTLCALRDRDLVVKEADRLLSLTRQRLSPAESSTQS